MSISTWLDLILYCLSSDRIEAELQNLAHSERNVEEIAIAIVHS
ncbi:hypothetical protein VB620_15745 [Nodularia harveyana UHCC-0300]|uniref:Uncharacterized protein n=1 Tax=Nodularia harveyana UHCC-0300 TaxID=2974287 RepID=A0ABU5UGV3_9CYAN|nr:hypothetical protein [Nodularia harveyana]MEA5582788.1 hypothetical protein [Nodularia harveyana UHCC-0300]